MKFNALVLIKATVFALALLLTSMLAPAALATVTDIANVPVMGGAGSGAKPNIMLLMDTSNSMSWTHMPDQVEVEGAKQSIGYKSSQCNSLYYNPDQTYIRPKDASNAFLPMPSFAAAPYDYFIDASIKVNLASAFQAHDAKTVRSVVLSVADLAQPAYYYVFTGPAGTSFSYSTAPCNVADTFVSGQAGTLSVAGGTWTRKLVTATSGIASRPDERENFAIWYTYYRTRMALAKSAIGRAFAPLNNTYRVGFLNGNPTIVGGGTSTTPSMTVQPPRYEKIADFDSGQKINWFSKLYGQQPAGSSPTREGLARVGRHYAGKTDGINVGMPEDPVQQACQPNFTILTTDGYWNTEAEKSAPAGGPTNIAGNASVGQQDSPWTPDTGLAPFGVYDGVVSDVGYTDTSSSLTHYNFEACSRTVNGKFKRVIQKTHMKWQKTVTTAPAATTTVVQKQTSQISRRTWNTFQSTSQLKETVTTVQRSTSQSVWYNPATETSTPVASCSGLSGCNTTTTGPTTVASCTPSPAASPNFMAVTCTTQSGEQGVSACSNPTCHAVTTGPAAVQGDQCWNDVPWSGNNYTQYICSVTNDSTQFVSSCSGNFYSASGNQTCSYSYSGWSNAPGNSCNSSGGAYVGPNFINTECRTVGVCVPTAANNYCAASVVTTIGGSCTPSADTTCILVTTSGPTVVDPATCTPDTVPSAANNWQATFCTAVNTVPVADASCVPIAPTSPMWEETLCTGSTTAPGVWRRKTITTTSLRTYNTGATVGPNTSSSWWPEPNFTCLDPATVSPLLPDQTVQNPPVVVAGSVSGGSTNSLADVAQYYYKTDLRPGMPDMVRPAGTGWGDDRATWQHMTTFVVGLGVSGTLKYREDYPTATAGDFASIRSGAIGWPRWPEPTLNYSSSAQLYNDPRSIDDFWHTAVNGRGRYFSANNPDSVVSGIRGALSAIDATVAAGSGVAISDLEGVTLGGINYASNYLTGRWVGDVEARIAGTLFWSAKAKLDAQTQADCDDRRIFYRNPGSTNDLGEFTWNTKVCASGNTSTGLTTAKQALFTATGLSQYVDMTSGSGGTVNQVAQATGASLVNFLRGQRQNENFASGVTGKLYRLRDSVLGDIINSKPQYLGPPYRDFVDAGYTAFKTAQAARIPMVYVGANDGMLHAFYAPAANAAPALLAKAGTEAWSYVPTKVMPNLVQLADKNYTGNHRYFVDGSPVEGDVQSGGNWRSILVGGLNAGGKGFYALDITDPESPKSLWEFDSSSCTGCDVGLSFGRPVIGKLKNGTWVVFLTSGYNNSTGIGTLFIVNAVTGALIRKIDTGVGSTATPSGLAQVSAWTDYPGVNDMAARVYGGDLLGNIWRFDINNSIEPAGYEANLIGTAKDSSGAVQPITTAPELGLFGRKPFVYLGTGRLLGESDLANTQTHSVYGIYDNLNLATPVGTLRSVLKRYITKPDFTLECQGSTASCAAVNDFGWMVDLSESKEQINLSLTLIDGTLVMVTNQPTDGVCTTGSVSRVYFGYGETGETLGAGFKFNSNGLVGVTYTNRASTATTSDSGTSSVQGNPRDATGTQLPPFNIPIKPRAPGTSRISWRELIQR